MAERRLGYDEMFCFSCGSIIKKQAEICVHCGVRVSGTRGEPRVEEYSGKSRLAAGLLGILLGSLGIHRFYLGNIGIAIAQIFVTLITFGFGGLWGLVEGIIIIAGASWRDSEGKLLRKYGQ